MLKAFPFRFQLNTTKAGEIEPKLTSWSFRVFGSFAVMAEGGKVSVDDGKSTDGKKETA